MNFCEKLTRKSIVLVFSWSIASFDLSFYFNFKAPLKKVQAAAATTPASPEPSEAKKKFKAGVSKLKALPAFLQAGNNAAAAAPMRDLSKVAVKKLEEKEFLKRENGMLVTTNKKVEDRDEERKKSMSVADRAKLFR